MKKTDLTGIYKPKVYCKHCARLHSFDRFYCGAVKETRGISRVRLNKDNDCKYYKTAKWKENLWHFKWLLRYGIWDFIKNIPREIMYFFQRGIRGWSDRDIWDLDQYLSNIILNGLVELKRIMHCIPSTINPITKEWDYDEKRWKESLDKMIDGFAILKKCTTGEELMWIRAANDEDRKNVQEIYDKYHDNCRVITQAEEKQIEEAFDLLKLYFWNLGD